MRSYRRTLIPALLALLVGAPAFAQSTMKMIEEKASEPAKASTSISTQPAITMQHFRPADQRGLLMFEPPKNDEIPYNGFRLDLGAAFTQQMQALKHSNTASERLVNGVNANKLMEIGTGFNNAAANLFLNAQLAPGIRVALTTYLSSRHHNEAWVKDGYLLVDELPVNVPALNKVMEYVTVKAGHFEINYGDAHFRRSDNGNALYNPFVGNLVMDAFTTEIGTEVYLRAAGFMAMGSVTGGEIKGNILTPDDRSPAYIFKLGYDKQFNPDLRVRLTGSHYAINRSPANTLFAGDRAGSRYFFVLENTQATSTANPSSGLINPGFRYKVDAMQINPYLQFKGLELFGVIEQAKGRAATETAERTWKQYAADAVYRFGGRDALYVAGRYNTAFGALSGVVDDVSVDRYQVGGGWFITPSILLKGEYVNQKYFDFPVADIRNGGKFSGLVIEGVVAF
jgi:hypothetical protein